LILHKRQKGNKYVISSNALFYVHVHKDANQYKIEYESCYRVTRRYFDEQELIFTTEDTEVHRGGYKWSNGRYRRYDDGCAYV